MKKPLPVAEKLLEGKRGNACEGNSGERILRIPSVAQDDRGADLSLRPYGPPPSSEGGLGSKKKWRNKI